MAKITVEFIAKGGDKVQTSNEAIIQQLDEMGAAYKIVGEEAENAAETQVDANNKVEKSYKDIIKEFKAAEKELKALAIAGDTTSERYLELQQKVSAAKDALEDNARAVAANKSGFDSIAGAVKGVTGGFAAAQGALGVFGVESENVEKALLKVQSALALSQGIEQLIDSKDAFLSLGNAIKGPVSKAFTGLRGAIIATGIGALVVGLGLLIANFDKIKEVVLKLIPGLANVGKFITGIVNAVTDFIGVTSEAERAADRLAASSKKIFDTAQKDIEVLKAGGATAKEIYDAEKKANNDRLAALNKIAKDRGKLTEDELKERADLVQKNRVLDAQETNRLREEAKKRGEDAKKAREDAQKKAEELRQKEREADLKDAERRAALIKNELDREIALRELKYQEELELAKKNGEDLKLLEQVFLQDIAAIRKKFFDADNEARAKEYEDRLQKQQQINESLLELEQKSQNLSLQRRLEIYDIEFKEFADNERKKFATASQAEKDKLEEYLNALSEKQKAEIRFNDAVDKLQSEFNIKSFQADEELNRKKLEILGDPTLSFKEQQQQIALLDEQAKLEQLQRDLDFVNERLKIAEADPYFDKERLAQLKANAAQLQVDIKEQTIKFQEALKDFQEGNIEGIIAGVEKIAGQIFSVIGQITDVINQSYDLQAEKANQSADAQIEALNRQRDAQLNNARLTAEERTALEEDFAIREAQIQEKRDAELKRIEKKRADLQFAIAVAEIITNTAIAIAKAVNISPATGGLPFSAIAAAQGAIQLATARAQRNSVRSLGRGGILVGPSHSAGGIRIPGTSIEVEGGEAVINKRSTAMFGGLLSAINEAGGGRTLTPNYTAASSFQGGGIVDTQAITSAVREGIVTGTAQTRDIVRAYIVQSEIDSNIARSSRIRRQATF